MGIKLGRILASIISIQMGAGVAFARGSQMPDGCPASGAPAAAIPFTLIGDHIYVQAAVNGTGPFRFIVDTGGVNLIDAGLIKPLALKITGKEIGHGAGPEAVESDKTTIDRIKLGDGVFTQQGFYTFDFKQLYASGGVEMKGMIGAPLFRRRIMCIDFDHKEIDLIDPERFDPSQAGAPLPISFSDSVVTVNGSFDGIPGRFQIDTGSPTTLTLYAPFVAQQNLLARFPRHVETMNSGVGGSTPSYTVRGRNFVLGSAHIDHPITSFATGSKGTFARSDISGNVGIGALKRYVATFDFVGKRLFLKPYQPAPSDLDTYDRSGLQLAVEPAGFRVGSVGNGTPASEAGLGRGDLVVSINGRPANTFTLPVLRDDLRQWSAGSVVTLEVQHNNVVRSVRLKLRDLL